MGPHIRCLSMLYLLLSLLGLSFQGLAQNPGNWSSARALDGILQDYAFRAFPSKRVRTGTPYDGTAPSNLMGIKITAMRIVRGSLKSRGVSRYKEFEIPKGVDERPWVKRLVLVYQNLGNWSELYYPLSGFTYLAPVLALLVYNATNLTATNLPELNIMALRDPIMVNFSSMSQVPEGSTPKCVRFNLQGSVNFSNVMSGNRCFTTEQGHFSVVVESIRRKKSSKVWIIVGSVLGGLLLLILLIILGVWLKKRWEKMKLSRMEREADDADGDLSTLDVSGSRVPAAPVTRTKPILEQDYVP